ncbi:hypothetical protein VU07_04240, partial [Desulfobulbus sp. F4]|nr:hypothetical protein [Desulfobulbus sp. F4]
MKMKFRTIAAPLLLGCALLVSGLVSAKENTVCNHATPESVLADSKRPVAEESGIAISKAGKAEDEWTYKVTNTGSVKLTNVRVTDKRLAKVSCEQDALEAGETMGCTAAAPDDKPEKSSIGGCAVADH